MRRTTAAFSRSGQRHRRHEVRGLRHSAPARAPRPRVAPPVARLRAAAPRRSSTPSSSTAYDGAGCRDSSAAMRPPVARRRARFVRAPHLVRHHPEHGIHFRARSLRHSIIRSRPPPARAPLAREATQHREHGAEQRARPADRARVPAVRQHARAAPATGRLGGARARAARRRAFERSTTPGSTPRPRRTARPRPPPPPSRRPAPTTPRTIHISCQLT